MKMVSLHACKEAAFISCRAAAPDRSEYSSYEGHNNRSRRVA